MKRYPIPPSTKNGRNYFFGDFGSDYRYFMARFELSNYWRWTRSTKNKPKSEIPQWLLKKQNWWPRLGRNQLSTWNELRKKPGLFESDPLRFWKMGTVPTHDSLSFSTSYNTTSTHAFRLHSTSSFETLIKGLGQFTFPITEIRNKMIACLMIPNMILFLKAEDERNWLKCITHEAYTAGGRV